MSKIALTLPDGESACQGKLVSFIAPCNNEEVTCVRINGKDYTLKDTRGSTEKNWKFTKGTMVSVILDFTENVAYIQNASYDIDTLGVSKELAKKEDTSNKVTSVSSDSTDDQYPSAKCLADINNDIRSDVFKLLLNLSGTVSDNHTEATNKFNAIADVLGGYHLRTFQTLWNVPAGESLNQTVSINCYPGVNKVTIGWIYGVSEYYLNVRSGNCDILLLSQTTERANSPVIAKNSEGNYEKTYNSGTGVLTIRVTTGVNGGSSGTARDVFLLSEGIITIE